MKKLLMFVFSILMISSSMAASNISAEKMSELIKEKEYVYQQEIKKVQSLMGIKKLKRQDSLSFLNKSNKRIGCDEDDIVIDIDVDVNHHDDEDEFPQAYCESRWSDGTCASYGSDVITDEVSSNCQSRWSDGTCASYGSDHVGGTCYPNCQSRWSDGTCASYGADICTDR